MLEDEQLVLDEIGHRIAKERESLRKNATAFSPRSRGRALPLWVNVGALVALLVLGPGLWYWYTSAQEAYVLKAAQAGPKGTDIIAALLAEAQDTLAAKNREIAAIEDELKTIAEKLTRLGLGDIVERKVLTDRRTVLQGNLAKALQQRDALTRQVVYQAKSLEAAKGGAAADPLADLREQSELRKVYEQNQRTSWKTIAAAVEARRWDAALAEAGRARAQAATYAAKGADTDRAGALAQASLLGALESLLTNVKVGPNPAVSASQPASGPEDFQKLTDVVKVQTAQLKELSDELYQSKKTSSDLQKVNQESALQLDAILKSLGGGTGTAGVEPAPTTETLPIRIKELQQVAAKVQDYQVLVKKQASELAALKATPVANPQMDATLGSFTKLLGVYAPDEAQGLTAENLPAKIEVLQKKLAAGQDTQGLLQQQVALVEAAQAKTKALEAERDKLAAQVALYVAAGKDYQNLAAGYAKSALTLDRASLHASFESVNALFKDNATLAAQFPNYSVYLATLVQNLIDVEVARTKALAEDQLLTFMAATSNKIADEQVRLAARASNAKEDATAVFTSLIKEIDQVTATTLKSRTGQVLPRALGSVLSVSKPNVTVRKVARFETFQVKRVFLSRILATGERIPIAEAEIVATSGEDILLKIISTLAPTIYPERNDLVFVEL